MARAVSLDEPCIKRRRIVSPGRTPEVIVALGFEDRCDSHLCLLEICDLKWEPIGAFYFICNDSEYAGSVEALEPKVRLMQVTAEGHGTVALHDDGVVATQGVLDDLGLSLPEEPRPPPEVRYVPIDDEGRELPDMVAE